MARTYLLALLCAVARITALRCKLIGPLKHGGREGGREERGEHKQADNEQMADRSDLDWGERRSMCNA